MGVSEPSFINIVAIPFRKRLALVALSENHNVVWPDVAPAAPIPFPMDELGLSPNLDRAPIFLASEADEVKAGRGVILH
jgi:hypothetical protein